MASSFLTLIDLVDRVRNNDPTLSTPPFMDVYSLSDGYDDDDNNNNDEAVIPITDDIVTQFISNFPNGTTPYILSFKGPFPIHSESSQK